MLWSRPVNSDNAAHALTATWPLVSGAKDKIISAASMAVSKRGWPLAAPSQQRCNSSSAKSFSSFLVSQLMPLPPLPNFANKGPIEVKRA
jgi:hypothetical protein